jgi:MFS transporter, FHS family, glucose/mannose:H+ symporter
MEGAEDKDNPMREMMRAHAGLLFAGVATFILMGAGQSVYGPALPAFARDFGQSLSSAGWLVSAHWVGCALGVVVMFLTGPRITPRGALAVMASGAAVIAAGAGWWGTLTGAVVYGGGYGMATVAFNPRVLRAFGARGTAMLSLLNATFGIGAIGTPLIFVALGSDPQRIFALIAGLSALVWFGAGAAGRQDAGGAATAATTPFRPHWPILGFGAVAIGMEACLIGLGPTALIAAGETEVRAAELLSTFFVAFLMSRTVLIFTAHLLPSFTLFTLAGAGAALSALGAIFLAPGLFFVMMGVCAGLFFPGYYVTASRRMGDDPRVPALIIAAGLVGGIGSPVLVARLLDGGGDRAFFWVLAGVAGAMALAAMASLRQLNR